MSYKILLHLKNAYTSERTKKEWGIVFGILIAIFAILKVVYFREQLGTLMRASVAVWWMTILPGYVILHKWQESIDFLERIIVGSVLSLGMIGSASYFLGLFSVSLQYQAIYLTILVIGIGLLIEGIAHTSKQH